MKLGGFEIVLNKQTLFQINLIWEEKSWVYLPHDLVGLFPK